MGFKMHILEKFEINKANSELERIREKQGIAFIKKFIKEYENANKQKRNQDFMKISSSFYLLRCQGSRRKEAISEIEIKDKISESSVSNHITKLNSLVKANRAKYDILCKELEYEIIRRSKDRWFSYTKSIEEKAKREGIAYKLCEAIFFKYVLEENKQKLLISY